MGDAVGIGAEIGIGIWVVDVSSVEGGGIAEVDGDVSD